MLKKAALLIWKLANYNITTSLEAEAENEHESVLVIQTLEKKN